MKKIRSRRLSRGSFVPLSDSSRRVYGREVACYGDEEAVNISRDVALFIEGRVPVRVVKAARVMLNGGAA